MLPLPDHIGGRLRWRSLKQTDLTRTPWESAHLGVTAVAQSLDDAGGARTAQEAQRSQAPTWRGIELHIMPERSVPLYALKHNNGLDRSAHSKPSD